MQLELDGKKLEKHPAAQRQPKDTYLSNFRVFLGHTPDNLGFNQSIYNEMMSDPDQFNYYLGKAIEHLGTHPLPWNWGRMVGKLADRLDAQKEILELTQKPTHANKLPPPTDKEGLIPLDLPKPLSLGGSSLKKGTVVFNGDLNEVSAPEGGIIIVNGNVQKIEGGSGYRYGMIYVNGDVSFLDNMGHMMLAVTGSIEKYEQDMQTPGGLRLEMVHSPFLFNPQRVEAKRLGFLPNQYGRPMREGKDVPGMIVESERLNDWRPEEVREKMLELCRERIQLQAERIVWTAQQTTDPEKMMNLYLNTFEGKKIGYSRGYYDSPGSTNDD